MPSPSEIRVQVASEAERRQRLAVPAFAGGFLYLLSAIILSQTFNGAPTVGLLQGLEPALSGVANPAVSPRTAEVKFVSHHALALIAGATLAAIAVGALVLVVALLLDATRFRRPETWAAARPLVLAGGIAWALANVVHEVISAIETHKFAVGHDHSIAAANHALTGPDTNAIAFVALLAGLALAVGMIATMINALRVGLIPRWMSFLGIFTGLFIFLPVGAELQVIPALWMVMMGVMFIGKWPKGTPPAWEAGEAVPWLTPAQQRGGRTSGSEKASGGRAGSPAAAAAGVSAAPAPTPPSGAGSSRKRRRKRGGRG